MHMHGVPVLSLLFLSKTKPYFSLANGMRWYMSEFYKNDVSSPASLLCLRFHKVASEALLKFHSDKSQAGMEKVPFDSLLP